MEGGANGELLEKIKAQGDVVRKLKEQKAEKVKVKTLLFHGHKNHNIAQSSILYGLSRVD